MTDSLQPLRHDPVRRSRPVSAGAGPDLGRDGVAPTGDLRVLRRPAGAVIRRVWPTSVVGEQRVPTSGPVILAPNHLGTLDGPLIVLAPRRTTYAMAKAELFTGRTGPWLRRGGQIPVERDGYDLAAIRAAVRVLEAGHQLAIFPEGERGRGDQARIRRGVTYLALLTGAPVVPVAILGTRQPGASLRSVPRPGTRVSIVYGDPIEVPRTPWPRSQAYVGQWTERVQAVLADHVRRAEQITGMSLPDRAR